MKRRFFLVFAIIGAACQVATDEKAEPKTEVSSEKRKKLAEIYDAMDLKAAVDSMFDPMLSGLPAEMSACLKRVIPLKEMETWAVEILLKLYNDNEIGYMHKFYTSEIGRAIAKKMPKMSRDLGLYLKNFMTAEMPKIVQQCTPQTPGAPGPSPTPTPEP